MSTIASNSGNSLPPGLTGGALGGQSADQTASAAQAGLAGMSAASQAELLQRLTEAAKTMGGASQKASQGDGVTDARGAPSLEGPTTSFNTDDMVALLRTMRSKSQDGQLQAAKGQVEAARIKAEKNTEAQLDKINEWVEKCEEAKNQGLLGKIFGWIGKIVAVIAAAVAVAVAAAATVATGGAAAPLLAVAVIGMIGATISLADQISKECGGPEISIGNLITTAVGKFLEACGVPEETANKIGKVMAGVMAIAAPALLLVEPNLAATMATGICELAGAPDDVTAYVGMAVGIAAAVTVGIAMAVMSGGAGAGTAVMSTSTKIANGLIGAGAQIANGVTQVGVGATNIAKAHTEREAEGLLADKQELSAAMVKLQQQMEDGREEMKKIIQQIEEGLQAVTQMINGTADSMSQITANLGKRMAV